MPEEYNMIYEMQVVMIRGEVKKIEIKDAVEVLPAGSQAVWHKDPVQIAAPEGEVHSLQYFHKGASVCWESLFSCRPEYLSVPLAEVPAEVQKCFTSYSAGYRRNYYLVK
jgi:hypothetical protein